MKMYKKIAGFCVFLASMSLTPIASAQPDTLELTFTDKVSNLLSINMGVIGDSVKNITYKGRNFTTKDGFCTMSGMNRHATFGMPEGVVTRHISHVLFVVQVEDGNWIIYYGGGRRGDQFGAQCFLR